MNDLILIAALESLGMTHKISPEKIAMRCGNLMYQINLSQNHIGITTYESKFIIISYNEKVDIKMMCNIDMNSKTVTQELKQIIKARMG